MCQLYDLMIIRCSQSLLYYLHEVPPFEFLSPVPLVAVSYKAVITHVKEYDYHNDSCQNLQNSPNRPGTLAVPVVRFLDPEVDQSKVGLQALHLMCSDPRLIEFDLFFK